LRIISGKYRGKNIIPGKHFNARPTTDYAKEALFNILRNRIDFEKLKVLDLFSGTGSISYEFISMGAQEIMAVEINRKYTEFIEKTASDLDFENLIVLQDDVLKFIPACKNKYDIVFADPPYDLPEISLIPELVLKQEILNGINALFIMEHGPNLNFSDNKSFMEMRNYGKVHFSFFNNNR